MDNNQLHTGPLSASIPDNESKQQSGPVMDVQPPARPAGVTPGLPAQPVPASTPPTAIPSAGQPLPVAQPNQPDAVEHPAVQQAHEALQAHATSRPSHAKVIIVAVIVALLLGGLTVFVYLQSQQTTKHDDGQTDHQETSATTETQPATVSDVDSATTDIDSILTTADATQDFPETSISDQSLGL